MKNKRDKVNLVIFIGITLTAGFFGYLIDQVLTDQPKGNSLGMGVWLVLPLLTGIIQRIVNKDFGQFGIRPRFKNHIKWYMLAILVFPFITILSVILAKLFGVLDTGKMEVVAIGILAVKAFFSNCIKNIFEEFSWRGCLVPYLEKIEMNDWLLYLTSGLIWGMWHITYYLFFLPDEYFTDVSRPRMVVIGIALMIMWSPLFVELRRLTNSVWPCVILHSMEDAVPTLLFVTSDVFRIKESFSIVLDPISGILSSVVVVLLGLGLRKYRLKERQWQAHNVI